MNILEIAEKLSAITANAFSSWPSLATNAVTGITIISTYSFWSTFYDKLINMNNPFLLIGAILLSLSAYGLLYRSVSTVALAISRHKASKQKAQEAARNIALLKQSIYELSQSEIALIKFFLKLDVPAAWLPNEYLPVILLEEKHIIRCVDILKSKSIPLKHGSSINTLCNVYQLTSGAQKIIHEHLLLKSPAWKKIKPNNTFCSFQEDQ